MTILSNFRATSVVILAAGYHPSRFLLGTRFPAGRRGWGRFQSSGQGSSSLTSSIHPPEAREESEERVKRTHHTHNTCGMLTQMEKASFRKPYESRHLLGYSVLTFRIFYYIIYITNTV